MCGCLQGPRLLITWRRGVFTSIIALLNAITPLFLTELTKNPVEGFSAGLNDDRWEPGGLPA